LLPIPVPDKERTMRATTLASVTLLGAALVACDRLAEHAPTAAEVRPPAADLVLPADQLEIMAELGVPVLQPGDGEQSATGGVWYGATVNVSRLAFSAIRHRDGTVTGQFNFVPGNTILDPVKGPVDCLIIAGNTARFSGHDSRFPDDPNAVARFTVADNGEGAGAPPDLVTGPRGGSCDAVPFPTATSPVIRGNLQVRP
jgi:hypothetical protein